MTPEEFKTLLETQTRLEIAEFGIQSIINLCGDSIEIFEQSGKTGKAVNTIKNHAENIQKRINDLPGGKS